ncbi:restriction endonuclease [Vespertiliibacter pulmonis]|nr:restriction endonuclease [Vespertiliibacter pulmonis]
MSGHKIKNKSELPLEGKFPVYSSDSNNNGVVGYIDTPTYICNEESKIYVIFGEHTRSFNIADTSFSILDNVKVLKPLKEISLNQLFFIISSWKKEIPNLGYARHWKVAKNIQFFLPVKNNEIDFDFIEEFISELQAERLQELQGYLRVTGLSNYTLNEKEKNAIARLNEIEWGKFNLEKLFGKATRGKRLKSADRISGLLPFVTAGETDTGISAFIGNKVDVFNANTITIDMFGSAKYRNYSYGADDHIAVVHCDHLMKEAVLFLTSAIHKVSNSGQFSYARNFYAKDADQLNISLPIKNGIPDYELMSILGSAIQKLVIEDVVKYTDREIMGYQQVISS